MSGDAKHIAAGQSLISLPKEVVHRALRDRPLLRGLLPIEAGFSPGMPRGLGLGKPDPDSWLFLYCVKGRGWCETRGRTHPILAGDLLVSRMKECAVIHGQDSPAWAIHWVRAEGTHLSEYLTELKWQSSAPVLHPGEDPQITRLFGEVFRALKDGAGFAHMLQASSALAYLLSLVLRKRQESAPDNQRTLNKIAQSIIYMSEHLNESSPISGLARLAGLSPTYFGQLFKEQTGSSPRGYLHLLRMHKACQLLHSSDWTVKEVASQVGYRDPFHFSRQFKSFQGVSPTQYRQRPE